MRRSLILLGLAAIFVFAVSLSHAIEEDDILVYYSFDKLSGNKVTDDSGNGNDAELVGKGFACCRCVQESHPSERWCRPNGTE